MPVVTLTSDGLSIACVLMQPDWESELSVSHHFAARITEGLSDRENRVPEAEQMVLAVTCVLTAEEEEAQALRDTLATIGTGWVGIPIWRDQFLGSAAPAIYDAQRLIDLTSPAIVPKGEALDVSHTYAPLVVGHIMELPPLKPVDASLAECELTLTEDSPWAFRISAAAAVSAGAWPPILEPDWSEPPSEQPVRELEFERIGMQREQVISQQERSLRWTNDAVFTLDTAEAATLIAFYRLCRGPWTPFPAPFWYTPGSPTAAAPHGSTMRFDDAALVVRYVDGQAEASVRLVEVPWEIAGVADEIPQQPARVYLYQFTYALPSPVVYRFTNCWRPLTRAGDGTYQPAPMEHEDLTSGLTMVDEAVTLNSFVFAGNPLAMFNPPILEGRLWLRIYEVESEPLNPDAATLVWFGSVSKVPQNGRRYTAECRFLGGLIDREGPMVRIGPSCNVNFGSAKCGHAIASFTKTGTLATSSGSVVTVTISDEAAANTYAPGVISVGSGASWETRSIIASAPTTGGQQFTLDRPLRQAASGQGVSYYRSCDRSVATCKALDPSGWRGRFRGHPNLPIYSLSLPTADSQSSGKK